MEAKPLTSEAIALTEKKMDMSLDDIIKMSKKPVSKAKKQRASNKSQKFFNAGSNQGNASKMRRYMDSRSSIRQGALAQRRSNFQDNQFPMVAEAAKKAAAAPIRPRAVGRNRMINWNNQRTGAAQAQRRVADGGFAGRKQQQQLQTKVVPKQRPQTLDSLFANMKEQRMKTLSQQQMNARRNGVSQQHQRRRGQFNNYSN